MDVFLPKSNARDFSSYRFVNDSRHARRLSRLLKPQTNGTTELPVINDDGSWFPGKSNPLQTRCFYLHRSVQRWGGRDKKWAEKLEVKENTAAKMTKPENVLWGKTTNWQTAFILTIRGDFSCFCIEAGTLEISTFFHFGNLGQICELSLVK